MKVIGDYHTHTIYSHGKGTIEENVLVAREKGLSVIGIADHGPGHRFYGVKRENFKVMRDEIDRLNELYDDIEILLGVEANLLDFKGTLDIDENEIKYLDYIAAGYHFGIMPKNVGTAYSLYFQSKIMNMSNSIFEKLKEKTTDSLIKAVEDYDIMFLSHPGAKVPVDVVRLNQACIENDTLLEVNGKHGYLTVDDLKLLKGLETKLILGSDAHSPHRVGEVAHCLDRVRAAGLDLKNIVNIESEGGSNGVNSNNRT